MKRAPAGRRWRKVGTWATLPDGGHRICAACRTPVRSYRYRFHPAASDLYERCIGLSWCSPCRVYTGAMVHVPRDKTLDDALADLGQDQRERLERSEVRLIAYLDGRIDHPDRIHEQ
ncbi:hypothetical protein [Actinocorallia populi]|uniref:hypothetical protein n=1 Tax=Actinocorallia populi TaxID=2079200 RepID=UPI000D0917A8|nr:hypothetical protein [Actinocorallia populi]